jgi:hypothetical protein
MTGPAWRALSQVLEEQEARAMTDPDPAATAAVAAALRLRRLPAAVCPRAGDEHCPRALPALHGYLGAATMTAPNRWAQRPALRPASTTD